MIADDEAHIRNLFKLIVTSLGAEVVAEAADGEQALSLLKSYSSRVFTICAMMESRRRYAG